MRPEPRRPATYAEYLGLEAESEVRHEFLDGQIWAMGGGTPRHSRIKTNLLVDVAMRLGDAGPCQVYDTDLRVRVLETGLATHPDLTVVCGPLALHPDDADAVTNPTVVLEVLSPSTEGWDRGGKFQHLGQAPSLRHYVLVAQDQALVEVYTRIDDDRWDLRRFGPGARAPLPALGIDLDVDALYRNLPG